MSQKRTGIQVRYWNPKKDQWMTGIVWHDEQKDSFKNYNKFFIRLIDPNTDEELTDENGKKLIALKNMADVQITGFIN